MVAGAAERFVTFAGGDLLVAQRGQSLAIQVSDNDNVAVRLAAKNLATDIGKVCGARVDISSAAGRIVAGTIGQSAAIDALVRAKRIDGNALKGRWEKYIITIVDGQLVIAGSDRRGTVYGIYELSRQIGVSPWYYWMDVPVATHDSIYASEGVYTDGEPAVRYRGIFLNDEGPCLMAWVKNTFGTNYGDHNFYAHVFELILRLKGNYMWPAMWAWAFYADDPLNSQTADDMGVIIGTSHHEPMCRSQKEWHNHTDDPNREPQDLKSRQEAGGRWDYSTNKDNLDRFWLGGVERNKHTEDIITIGMRGDGDMAMSEERNVALLESVVENQRKLIAKAHGRPASEVPQLWALYKEVLDYYDDGMRVPDDVTMLLCDDNWGNIRRLPNARERKRKGGWGLYYHVDYVGAPRNSKWLNVTPTQHMWEQLSLAYNGGIDRLWILNVGDLKPMEYPITFFMDMAWNPQMIATQPASQSSELPSIDVSSHTVQFCTELFGAEQGAEAGRILDRCCKLNGRSTAEMLDATTYNLASGEWQRVVDEYRQLEIEALRQYASLPAMYRDAYDELILFPIEAMSNIHQMYYAQAQNRALSKAGDAAANEWAERCEQCFKRDAQLMAHYNKEIAGGKWDGMMIQKHIGYTTWQDNFPHDMQPSVTRIAAAQNTFYEDGRGYVSMEAPHFASRTEGSEATWTLLTSAGRTLGGVTLMPQTKPVDGASLSYRFQCSKGGEDVKVHVITKSTLDYLNQGGLRYRLMLDGCAPIEVNFNSDLNEAPENIYSRYYPTVARRVVEKVVTMPLGATADFLHTLTFAPLDAGIVLEKIVVDCGGYKPQYLFGEESMRR